MSKLGRSGIDDFIADHILSEIDSEGASPANSADVRTAIRSITLMLGFVDNHGGPRFMDAAQSYIKEGLDDFLHRGGRLRHINDLNILKEITESMEVSISRGAGRTMSIEDILAETDRPLPFEILSRTMTPPYVVDEYEGRSTTARGSYLVKRTAHSLSFQPSIADLERSLDLLTFLEGSDTAIKGLPTDIGEAMLELFHVVNTQFREMPFEWLLRGTDRLEVNRPRWLG